MRPQLTGQITLRKEERYFEFSCPALNEAGFVVTRWRTNFDVSELEQSQFELHLEVYSTAGDHRALYPLRERQFDCWVQGLPWTLQATQIELETVGFHGVDSRSGVMGDTGRISIRCYLYPREPVLHPVIAIRKKFRGRAVPHSYPQKGNS